MTFGSRLIPVAFPRGSSPLQRFAFPAIAGVALLLALSSAAAQDADAVTADDMVIGRDDAPVTVIEYFSFSCPHCARFHAEVFPALKRNYIDTGKVRFVLRDFPLNLAALSAAKLARCGGPERYFEFVDLFWARWDDWIDLQEPEPALVALLAEAGVDAARAEACRTDQALEDAALRSYLKGAKGHGVDATPTFIVDGVTYVGLSSYPRFAGILDELLE